MHRDFTEPMHSGPSRQEVEILKIRIYLFEGRTRILIRTRKVTIKILIH